MRGDVSGAGHYPEPRRRAHLRSREVRFLRRMYVELPGNGKWRNQSAVPRRRWRTTLSRELIWDFRNEPNKELKTRNQQKDEHSFSSCGLRQCRARSVANAGTHYRTNRPGVEE